MSTLACAIVLAVCGADPADATPSAPATRAGIEKAIQYLEREGTAWQENKKCASCHHVPGMCWAVNEARRVGIKVNETAYQAARNWMLQADNAAKVLPNPPASPDEPVELSYVATYATLGVIFDETADPNTLQQLSPLLQHVVATQKPSGEWTPRGSKRPPADESAEVATRLTRIALSLAAGRELKVDEAITARADQWLSTQPAPASQQVLALTLLQEALGTRDLAKMEALTQSLLALQKPDGGWSQTPDLDSDAYATGQALYALCIARSPNEETAIQNATGFLLKTQSADGNWITKSRPKPGETTGASDPRPIEYLGTTWATIGLARTLDRP